MQILAKPIQYPHREGGEGSKAAKTEERADKPIRDDT